MWGAVPPGSGWGARRQPLLVASSWVERMPTQKTCHWHVPTPPPGFADGLGSRHHFRTIDLSYLSNCPPCVGSFHADYVLFDLFHPERSEVRDSERFECPPVGGDLL